MRTAVAALSLGAALFASSAAVAAERWCAAELETLPNSVCYHEGPAHDGRRTLVVFLHGLVEADSNWQHHQQRSLVAAGNRLGFSVLAPRGNTGLSRRAPGLVAWPTGRPAQEKYEDALLATWTEARALVEARSGAFDEVFVVGFSNGGYYASSLALRGRLPVDGYALFAGGMAYGVQAPSERRPPVFIGITAADSGTADDGRALGRALEEADWSHEIDERKVGHTIADAHLDSAIAYLRKRRAPTDT